MSNTTGFSWVERTDSLSESLGLWPQNSIPLVVFVFSLTGLLIFLIFYAACAFMSLLCPVPIILRVFVLSFLGRPFSFLLYLFKFACVFVTTYVLPIPIIELQLLTMKYYRISILLNILYWLSIISTDINIYVMNN